MTFKEGFIGFFIFLSISAIFFYKLFLHGHMPFPGDLLIAEYGPWKSYSFIGYVPGSYPNKAQYFDVLRQLYPWKIQTVALLKNAELPLWNPYNFSGAPLLANFQSAVMYPLNMGYLFGNVGLWWSVLVFVQPLFASFFCYLYARQLKIGREGSILSGISYGFSYFMIVWLEYNTIGHAIAYVPLVLLSTEKLLVNKQMLWKLVFVFSIVSIFLAGHIQIAGYALVFILLYAFLRSSLREFIVFFFLTIVSLGITAIQMIPGFELILQSARVDHDYSFLTQKILIQPYQVIMLFVPDFFGNPAVRNYFLQDTYIGKVTSVGLISLFFASLTLFIKRNYHVTFFLVTAGVIGILITLNPFTLLMYSFSIPFVSSSAPTLATFLLAFSLSILAGFGFDNYKKQIVSMRNIFLCGVGFIILFFFLWLVMLFFPHIVQVQNASNLIVAKKALLYHSILLGVMMASIVIGMKMKRNLIYILFFLLLLQAGELGRAFHRFNPFVPADLVFPSVAIMEHIKKNAGIDRFWGYKSARIEANFSTAYSIFSPDGYDPLYPKRYGEFIHISEDGRILDNFSATTRSDANISSRGSMMENVFRLKALDFLGVRYILDRFENASSEKDFPDSRFKKVYQESGWTLYENLRVFPRAFFVSSYTVYSNKNDFERKFNATSFDASKNILLEKDLKIQLVPDANAKVVVESYTPNKIVFNTQLAHDQLLFVSDTFYPGWRASVNGKEIEILRAHYAFRAVLVPKGKHTLIMEYKPGSIKNGAIVSLISMGILIGGLIFFKKTKL